MAFSLIVGTDLVGRFDGSPFSGFSYGYYCMKCGEVFARRVEDGDKNVWVFVPSICNACGPKIDEEDFNYYCSFLLPGELVKAWRPLPILAAEFLYNFPTFMEPHHERASNTDAE